MRATAVGIGASLLLALAVTRAVPPHREPDRADRAGCSTATRIGSAVYAYNTINAFNLYAIKQPFWQSDLTPLPLFGIPASGRCGVGRRARARGESR